MFSYRENDNRVGVYLGNVETSSIPEKNSNYLIDKIVCDNETEASWDNVNWSLSVTNLSKRSNCKLYFRSKKDVTVTYDNNFSKNDIFARTYEITNMITCCQEDSGSLYTTKKFDNNIYTFTRKKYAGTTADRGIYLPVINRLTTGKTYYVSYSAKVEKSVQIVLGSEQNGFQWPFLTNNWQKFSYNFIASNSNLTAFIFYDFWIKDSSNTLYVGNIIMQEGGYDNYSTVTLKEYDSLGNMPNPTRDGYTFLGWYTEPIEGEKISDSTLVTEDTTYYAHWQYNG